VIWEIIKSKHQEPERKETAIHHRNVTI